MNTFVTDTHALLWYLAGSPSLGETARETFDLALTGTNEIHVPAIVLAELVILSEKRHAKIDATAIVAKLRETPGFQLTFLTPAIALGIQTLTALGDIHDRLIVAEALAKGASLIS